MFVKLGKSCLVGLGPGLVLSREKIYIFKVNFLQKEHCNALFSLKTLHARGDSNPRSPVPLSIFLHSQTKAPSFCALRGGTR
jgi:hypothetical protein